jgi:integrase
MARARFQRGSIIVSGKTRPTYLGLYREYVKDAEGVEHKHHRSTILGLVSEISKTEARKKFDAYLTNFQDTRPDGEMLLRTFVREKWLPIKQARWRASTKLTSTGVIEKQIVEPLGSVAIRDLDKSKLQSHVNSLAAEGFSESIIGHTISFLRQIFDECEESGFVTRSPARRLEMPRIQKEYTISPEHNQYTRKPFLGVPEMRKLFGALEGRDRLVAALAGITALRPGELLAAQWQAWQDDRLFVMIRVYRHVMDVPKSDASLGYIPVPRTIREMLTAWRAKSNGDSDFAYIFPGKTPGSVLDQYNWSDRTLMPAGVLSVGTGFRVTFQTLRRSAATNLHALGLSEDEVGRVLRHVVPGRGITSREYIQAVHSRLLSVLDAYADAVLEGLPEAVLMPVESETAKDSEQ